MYIVFAEFNIFSAFIDLVLDDKLFATLINTV